MMGTRTKVRTCTQLILGIVLTLLSVQSYAVERKVFYHNNLLGSPVAATDESGNLCWREDYRPYGEKIRNEDQGCGLDDNVVGYTGHVHDGDIGLTYMQARYYDPVVGRFMGVDPVGFRPNNTTLFNKYAYANNNPYKFKDPNGRLAFAIPAIVAAFEFLAAQFATVTVVATTVTAVVAVNKLDEKLGIHSAYDVMQNEEEEQDTANILTDLNEDRPQQGHKEKKGQKKGEVGKCPDCGGSTTNKPGKIASDHDLSTKEVKDRIHEIKRGGNLEGNPDLEVCSDCGEAFPQTDDDELGDSIGNINEEY